MNEGEVRAERQTLLKVLAVARLVDHALAVQTKRVGIAVGETATSRDVGVLDNGAEFVLDVARARATVDEGHIDTAGVVVADRQAFCQAVYMLNGTDCEALEKMPELCNEECSTHSHRRHGPMRTQPRTWRRTRW